MLEAAREAASSSTWSKGVQIARASGVGIESQDDGEIVAIVHESGGVVTRQVTLYLADADWECNCAGVDDICHHVAAAIIAVRRADRDGTSLPSRSDLGGRVTYRLSRSGRGLALEREIAWKGGSRLLETTLAAISSGRVSGPSFAATPADLQVEQALGSRYRGPVPKEVMARVFAPLSRCDDIRLDDAKISISTEPLGFLGRLDKAPGGYRLWVESDPDIREVFDNGSALRGDTLHPVAEARLTGRELEDLPGGRFYSDDETIELVTRVLPELRERIPVEIRAQGLPETAERMPPRIHVEVERRGDQLSVLPTLVYGDPPHARIDGDRMVHLQGAIPLRDIAAERACREQLRKSLALEAGRRTEAEGEPALALAESLDRWNGPIDGDARHEFYRAAPLVPELEIGAGGLSLSFRSEANGSPGSDGTVTNDDVFRAFREGESLVPLGGGGFAPLPVDWLERYGDRVARLLAARTQDGQVSAYAQPELATLCDDLDLARPAFLESLEPLLGDFESLPRAAPPADLDATLRPYQERGVDWLRFLCNTGLGALLADDMGLGKTLQALCAVEGRSLVVAPTSVMHNWIEEIRTRRPGLRHALYHGPGRQLDPEADITITSYAVLRLDIQALSAIEWDTCILDEAQAIKNPDSQVASAVRELRARCRIALTGTPVENRLEELWSQFAFLNPGLLGSRRDFRERVAAPIADGDPIATADLRKRLRPFVLRRLKRDVAPELPPRTEIVLHLELDEREREVYESIRAATKREVVEKLDRGGNVMAALEALLRLRQAACHAGLVPGQEFAGSSKVELLASRLEQATEEGHKALVFSQWTSLLDKIEPALRDLDIAFTRLDGSTRDRAGVVSEFQSETGPPVLLISLKAGGTGLNLTAADHVFLVDPWWNPAVEAQAADRAHRIGQDRPVLIHRLVARGTVEERILELQAAKRSLSEAALGEADAAASLTREDLLALLR